jgi:phosphoglycerate dehydrogenase-like enzyme
MSEPFRVTIVAGNGGGVPYNQADVLAQEITEALADRSLELRVATADEPLSAELDALLCSVRFPPLAHLPAGIGWVQVWGTGVDGLPQEVFDGTRLVSCARGAGAVPISEYVLAAMLAFEKRIPEIWIHEPPPDWYRAIRGGLGGLHGRTLAVLGLGSIGAAVARLGLAFGMEVRGLRHHEGPSPVPGVTVTRDPIELVTGAHHVAVTASATPSTRHIVGAGVLGAMGPDAHLVNIARGSLVDHDALRVALDEGRVGWASLDVTDPEPLPTGHWLFSHPHVRVSPHLSWNTHDGHAPIRQRCVANVVRRAKGEPLQGLVDPVSGY